MTHATPTQVSSQPEWKSFVQEICSGEAFRLFCDLFRAAIEGQKTRKVRLIGRRCEPEIFVTFLGYEVIGAGKRILCPDRVTARYLLIFAEIGLREVVIPYDVTKTQEILPELERAYAALKLIIDFFTDQILTKVEQACLVRQVYALLRQSLKAIHTTERPHYIPYAQGKDS